MSKIKTQAGYVVRSTTTGLYKTNNGSLLGCTGDQSGFFCSDQIKFFKSKPRKANNELVLQAIKTKTIVELSNYDLKDRKTLNE